MYSKSPEIMNRSQLAVMRSAVRSRLSPPTKRAFRKERPFLLVENEQREKRCAVRPSKSSARKRGGCISCGRFGEAKKDSGRHGANEVGGVPIAFLRRESAAFSAFHAENIRKCNRHGGGAAAGVSRLSFHFLFSKNGRISSVMRPDPDSTQTGAKTRWIY